MYYTEREVRELLEQAFLEGYDNGIDDTLNYIDENYEIDGEFDLLQEMDKYDKARFRDTMTKHGLNTPNTGLSKEGLRKQARNYIANHASSARKFSDEYKEKQSKKLDDHFNNSAENRHDIDVMRRAYARNLINRHVAK